MVVQIKIPCPDCNSTDVVRRGYTRSGKQRYLCGNPFCVRATFVTEYDYKGSLPETKETIIKMAMNGSEIRDTARVLGVSTTTVLNTLKKEGELSNVNILEIESIKLRQAEMPAVVICKVDREDRKSSEKTNKINELDNGKSKKKSVEVDEMWSFVESKKQQRWLWHAIDHMTGKVLAYVFGDRSDDCFIRLQQLLIPFGISTFHTDDWGAYNRWPPPEQHVVSKKHTQTIERKHLTLRTRLKRLAGKPFVIQNSNECTIL